MAGEGQQVQGGKHGGKVLLAVPEIVFQVVALGLQGVERLVFDLPACPATGGQFATVSRPTGKSVMKLLR